MEKWCGQSIAVAWQGAGHSSARSCFEDHRGEDGSVTGSNHPFEARRHTAALAFQILCRLSLDDRATTKKAPGPLRFSSSGHHTSGFCELR